MAARFPTETRTRRGGGRKGGEEMKHPLRKTKKIGSKDVSTEKGTRVKANAAVTREEEGSALEKRIGTEEETVVYRETPRLHGLAD